MESTTKEPVTIAAAAQIVTLDQRANKIRHLQADVQRGIIEIGFELIEAKKEIGHGNWGTWLETEFDWTDRTARYFMAVAERFGKQNTYSDLKPSTLKAMLALPEGDEQSFIDAQADAGKPVDKQSAREIQRNVKEWNEQRKPKLPTVNRSADTPETNPADAHVEESIDADDTIAPAQVDDDAGKLFVADKPLDSCRGLVCIDSEEPDETPQQPTDDDDLRKAQATAQTALTRLATAIKQTADRDTLQAVTQALNTLRNELEEKKLARNAREQKGKSDE